MAGQGGGSSSQPQPACLLACLPTFCPPPRLTPRLLKLELGFSEVVSLNTRDESEDEKKRGEKKGEEAKKREVSLMKLFQDAADQ